MTFSTQQLPLLLHLIFFFFIIFPLLNASQPKPCYTSSCGQGYVDVRFPFSLFPYHPESCGYTGYNLLCTDGGKTALKLPPMSEPFLVREIDYETQRIRLNDPDNCLARRLLNFDASRSPFSPLRPRNYTFLICPKEDNVTASFSAIDCLGNSTSSFFVVQLELVSLMPSSCQIFKTLPLPFSWSVAYTAFPGGQNSRDLWLKWDSPDCRDCERRTNSRCGFKNNTSLQVQCFSSVNSGLHNTGLQVLKIICLSLVGPLTALTFCVGLVMCSSERVSSQIQHAVVARLSGSVTVRPQPSDEVTRTGLDESTIESYKKVELGESRRLPTGSNDVVCSICLSEYATKESVRCLPECEHCFHTECIDAWLKLHSSCPVCRSNPSPTHEGCN
ncbi:PREDICTED: RING-H2 finger protein ATL22 [Camelina sativa]|uniref:RING-type E3 ubiquitin transferase n=1 Tax=Camelina sativa TaxID=90675 RepID=A0ABM0WCB3_CAMSA|nr:PREDICTED: RING-H2 finger protein ATL22 [Camelina sativa]